MGIKWEVKDYSKDRPKTRKEAIQLKCLECCFNNEDEVDQCEITSCPLHGFRSCEVEKREIEKCKNAN